MADKLAEINPHWDEVWTSRFLHLIEHSIKYSMHSVDVNNCKYLYYLHRKNYFKKLEKL